MEFVLTLLCAVSLAVGVFFAFTGVFGILKFPDYFARAQASTCISTLGVLGAVFSALLKNRDFQEMVRATLLDILRSPEGTALISQVIRKELDRRR